jgi:type VI secretion system protein ImpM
MFGFFEKAPSAKGANHLKLACFGKLPLHGDFIRHNLTTRETASFEKWLQEGVGTITRKHPKGWPPVYRQFPRYHFVLTGGEQESNLLGTLSASQDKSGRIYPFATLSCAVSPLLHNHRATLPLVYGDYFDYAAKLSQMSWASTSLTALTSELDNSQFENPASQQRQVLEQEIRLLADVPMKSYWEGLQTDIAEDGREQFWQTFYNVIKTVLQRGASRSHWGIRFPIPQEQQRTYVIFWIQMVESILEDRFWRAHYFWNEGSEENYPALTLFFRPLPPSYLVPLINQELEDNAIFDLGREWTKLSEFNSRIDLKNLLKQDDAPMLDVLYRTGRREML